MIELKEFADKLSHACEMETSPGMKAIDWLGLLKELLLVAVPMILKKISEQS